MKKKIYRKCRCGETAHALAQGCSLSVFDGYGRQGEEVLTKSRDEATIFNEPELAAFEARIAQVGEHKARMERLFALLGKVS